MMRMVGQEASLVNILREAKACRDLVGCARARGMLAGRRGRRGAAGRRQRMLLLPLMTGIWVLMTRI